MVYEFGTIQIKVAELIKERNLSKNKLSHRADMQRTQLNKYCNNQITRLDIEVLARISTPLLKNSAPLPSAIPLYL